MQFSDQYDDVIINSRWWTNAILKIVISRYLSSELSDFDQIWYADANFSSRDKHLTKNPNFANKMAADAIVKIVFGNISAPYRSINAKFWSEMKNHNQVFWSRNQNSNFHKESRWRTTTILKTVLSPYLSRELSDFDQIWQADANFHLEDGYMTKSRNSAITRWRKDAILKTVFGYI